MTPRTRCVMCLGFLLAGLIVAVPLQTAFALIIGGEGNKHVQDPGWPKGAAVIFNKEARIAWWEGPPFGGGQWHAEYRGDAKTLNAILAEFAELDVKSKRITVHDGVGNAFWLNPNNEPAKRDKAKMDWSFMVWQPKNWEHLRKLPADVNPTNAEDAKNGPPSQIDIYTGGNIKWADVIVPKGLTVVDRRLVAHGFSLADGLVLEGKVNDLATKKPIAAKVRLERVEPQPKGGYKHPKAAETVADAAGHWVIKKAPAGWLRVIIEADGFAPRVAGYASFDDQPRWQSYDTGLTRAATVTGRVTDDAGKPLTDVDVRFGDVTADGGRYESPADATVKTDKDGRFRAEQVPVGKATIWIHKPGYIRPGLGMSITTPISDIELTMIRSARIEVTVDFGGDRPKGEYLVQIKPEAGEKVGSYGGSGNINDKNQMVFDHVPPGRYVLTGRPNPGSDDQQTDPVMVDLKGGQTAKITVHAK